VAGYNLNELLGIAVRPHSYAGGGNGEPRKLSMARLVVGSEGTLLTILEPSAAGAPAKATAIDVIHYTTSGASNPRRPSSRRAYAVEVTDKLILDLARNNIEQARKMGWVQGDRPPS